MKIELKEITVRELTNGYEDNEENGVLGYDGKLDIRPPFQREFVYDPKERDAVLKTLQKDFPLNVMYWAVREDGNFEVIDGQQRTISICQYVNGDYSINGLAFHNLPKDKQEQILNYKLMVYFCSGTDSEKLDWFETINIAGKVLTNQELRNAVYSGSWVSDAKRYFSKNSRPKIGDEYLTGSANRQEYLETAIDWISNSSIKEYMSKNQHEPNANELWLYFQAVISWVKATFPKYRKEMKGIKWGFLYNEFKDKKFDPKKLEGEITTLMLDEDVENKKGIYIYVLTRKERFLNIRAFSDKQKREAYERQKGICPVCTEEYQIEEMEGDHITPWHLGGKTIADNCQMLCKDDNRRKKRKMTTEMNSTENYIKQKRLDLYNTIKTTKKIYLDTNYWIKLRDAEKNGNPNDKKLYDKLKELVSLKKCIVPISEITFWEILKQSDFKTLKDSATLIDEFSNGISLITDEERRQLEFFDFYEKGTKKSTYESIELVWTKLSMNMLYNNLPQPEQYDLKIKFIEFLESITFFDMVTIMEEKKIFKPFYFKDNVDFLNEAKEKYKNENNSFKQLFLSELGGYIDCFKDSLNRTMEQMYYWEHGKHITATDKSEIDQNGLRNLMYNMFKLNKVTTEFPTFSILPELSASVRWNLSRKYIDGNDTIDFLHATSALPYFDYFFTEKELRTIISQRKLDTNYNCIVASDTHEILDLLDTI